MTRRPKTLREDGPVWRAADLGPRALRDDELIALFLRGPEDAAVARASALLVALGGLHGVARTSHADLTARGVSFKEAGAIRCACEFACRLGQRRAAATRLDDASRIAELVGPEMRLLPTESARVVLLNAKLHLIVVEEVSRGLLDQALIHGREVFAPAFAHRAYAVVLVHNHPSGDPTPSEADIRMTRSLKEVSKVIDIPLLDHVIIGAPSTAYPEGWFSFKAAGYL